MKRIATCSLVLILSIVCFGKASPNVIFILMDDMGYSDVSCYGATSVRTPHIDRMAAEGLKFTNPAIRVLTAANKSSGVDWLGNRMTMMPAYFSGG